MPVSNNSSKMPNCAMPSSIAFCSGVLEKIAACASGQIQPNSDGPSRMPASNSPITEGWPIRCMISPRPRPTAISSTICATSKNSEGPAALPPSAPAAMVVRTSAAGTRPTGRSRLHCMQASSPVCCPGTVQGPREIEPAGGGAGSLLVLLRRTVPPLSARQMMQRARRRHPRGFQIARKCDHMPSRNNLK